MEAGLVSETSDTADLRFYTPPISPNKKLNTHVLGYVLIVEEARMLNM